jgi:hypothetical protein
MCSAAFAKNGDTTTRKVVAADETFTIKTSYNGGCFGGVRIDQLFDEQGNEISVSFPCCGQALIIKTANTDVISSGRKDLKIVTNHGELFYIKAGSGRWVQKPGDPEPIKTRIIIN